ncbi:MAG TPA: hypothetical protein VGM10_30860 [Actinocrinis sp.]
MTSIIIIVAVIVGAVVALFGWDRYRGGRKSDVGTPGSQPTGEVFIDPETNRRMRVWYDPATGRRDYRPE